MKILTASQMGLVDRLTTEKLLIPSLMLMENAGRAVADRISQQRGWTSSSQILVFCGKGNNGGDGLVAARHLQSRGFAPRVLLLARSIDLKGDARTNWELARAVGVEIRELGSPERWLDRAGFLGRPDIVLDALFGTGLSKPLAGEYQSVVEWINETRPRSTVIAIDLPSGLFADSSSVSGPSVQADITVTFTALKPALVLPPACERAGKVFVEPIGSPAHLLEEAGATMELADDDLVRNVLRPRPRDSHKGTYGHLHIVAGSRGKSGAALMSGMAALRSGAGLVTLWLPKSLHKDVIGKFPELMTEFLPETPNGTSSARGAERILAAVAGADALVIGPGLSTDPPTRRLVSSLVSKSPIPVLLDADGINAFVGIPEKLRNEMGNPIVLTPHPGEMGRLCGTSTRAVQSNRLSGAREFSTRHGVFTVLKGYQTLVASPQGAVLINPTGNPGMATAGSGDILSGICGRFLATWNRQRVGPGRLCEYLGAAVYLHGLAGDMAAEEFGMESLIATDLLPYLPKAFKKVLHA